MLSHPFGAGQVAIESMSCTIRFTIRVNVQHDPGNLSPVGSGRVGVEQTKVRNNVLLIVHRQRRVGRRRIVDIGIERPGLRTSITPSPCSEAKNTIPAFSSARCT